MFPRRGSVVSFNYTFWLNDPYPFVLVSDFIDGNKMRGFNLHYLTLQTIREVLKRSSSGAMPITEYNQFASIPSAKNAFRTYYLNGMQSIKVVDAKQVLQVMDMQNDNDPAEIARIREQINEQLRNLQNLDTLVLPDELTPPPDIAGDIPEIGNELDNMI